MAAQTCSGSSLSPVLPPSAPLEAQWQDPGPSQSGRAEPSMVQRGVKPGGRLEQEWLVGREKTLGPEGQGQEETPLEESSLVALGRSRKPVLQ